MSYRKYVRPTPTELHYELHLQLPSVAHNVVHNVVQRYLTIFECFTSMLVEIHTMQKIMHLKVRPFFQPYRRLEMEWLILFWNIFIFFAYGLITAGNKWCVHFQVTLPDGKIVDAQSWRTTPYEVACGISKGLADNSVISKVDGEVWDLDRPLEKSCALQLLKFDDEDAQVQFLKAWLFY